jgi:hypothetical protein
MLSMRWARRNCLFELLALGDVGVDGQDGFRLAVLVAHQRPAAFHDQGFAVFGELLDFTNHSPLSRVSSVADEEIPRAAVEQFP